MLEFVIVIAGVVVGFQVSAWNAERTDQARGVGYLERISADLAADISNYEYRMAFWDTVSEQGLQALAAVRNRPTESTPNDDWQVILNYFQASQTGEFQQTNTAYTEVTSAGELGLIGDLSIRSRISRYYSQGGNAALAERPAYRESVRKIIPITMQLYIWDNCFTMDGEQQYLLDCEPPASSEIDMAIVTDQLLSDTELHGELQYWLSTLNIALMIARTSITFAEDLRTDIASELEAN